MDTNQILAGAGGALSSGAIVATASSPTEAGIAAIIVAVAGLVTAIASFVRTLRNKDK